MFTHHTRTHTHIHRGVHRRIDRARSAERSSRFAREWKFAGKISILLFILVTIDRVHFDLRALDSCSRRSRLFLRDDAFSRRGATPRGLAGTPDIALLYISIRNGATHRSLLQTCKCTMYAHTSAIRRKPGASERSRSWARSRARRCNFGSGEINAVSLARHLFR